MLTPLCRYAGHLRAGRALVQSGDQPIKLLPLTLSFNFHPSFRQVPHSPAQAESGCLPKDKSPVENALHQP